MDSPVSFVIRAKKLGALIQDARIAAGKSVPECAQSIGTTEEIFLAYEDGDSSPSLPEIEVLAYDLQTPIEYFWGGEMLKVEPVTKPRLNPQMLLGLRHRMVGALLRKARLETQLSLDELYTRTGLSVEEIQAYELGEKPIPVPALDALSAALGYSTRHFQDLRGPIGKWLNEQRALQDFKKLSPDLQTFVSKPVNRPYLEMAQRLSEMPVDKLRAIAEGLLEITL